MCEYSQNAELKEFIRRGVRELLTFQRPDGYLGTYRRPEFVNPLPKDIVRAALGHENDWNWNIWCRKYTLWGLVEAYRLLGDADILAGAAKSADQLIAMLDKLQLTPRQTGTFNGMPSCSIMKPMLQLYEITGESRYLNFGLAIADDWAPSSESLYTKRWITGDRSDVPREKMFTAPHVRITAGPLLLARSKYIGNTEAEMFSPKSIQGENCSAAIRSVPDDRVRNAFELELTAPDGGTRTVKVCDYASAGNAILGDDSFFSVFF